MKKTIRKKLTALISLLTTLIMTGCGENATAESSSPIPFEIYFTNEPNDEGFKNCSIVATNTLSEKSSFTCDLTLYDKKGHVIEVIEDEDHLGMSLHDAPPCIDAGAEFAFCFSYNTKKDVDKIVAVITSVPSNFDAGIGDVTMSELNYDKAANEVSFSCINNNDYRITGCRADILYFNGDTYAGYDRDYFGEPDGEYWAEIAPGKQGVGTKEVSVLSKFDDMKVYAIATRSYGG